MRRLLGLIVLIPLAVALVMFAVANRESVSVSFDPFDTAQPAVVIRGIPLYLLIFILLGLGVVIGGTAAWLRQRKWRVRARWAEAETRELRARLDRQDLRGGVPARSNATPPLVVPPAA